MTRKKKEQAPTRVPWHGIGATYRKGQSVQAFMHLAGLAYETARCQLYADVAGRAVPVPGRYALIRTSDNRVLALTGDQYTLKQNEDLLTMAGAFAGTGAASLEAGGTLRNGKVVWILFRLADAQFTVARGDSVRGYLLLTAPQAPGKSLLVRTMTLRSGCQNTHVLTEPNGDVLYRQGQTEQADYRALGRVVTRAHKQLAVAERNAQRLLGLQISPEDTLSKVVLPLFKPGSTEPADATRTVNRVLRAINQAPNACPRTGWGVLNGIQHFCDHQFGHSQETRMYRAWVGDRLQLKLKAERLLLAMAEEQR